MHRGNGDNFASFCHRSASGEAIGVAAQDSHAALLRCTGIGEARNRDGAGNESGTGGEVRSRDGGSHSSATNRHPESKNPSPYHENGDESESTENDPLDHWFRGDEDGEAASGF